MLGPHPKSSHQRHVKGTVCAYSVPETTSLTAAASPQESSDARFQPLHCRERDLTTCEEGGSGSRVPGSATRTGWGPAGRLLPERSSPSLQSNFQGKQFLSHPNRKPSSSG